MFRRVFLFALAIIVFALGIGVIFFLLNLPSRKEKTAWDRIRQQETALARSFDIVVIQSGFLRRSTGQRDIYIPALLVQAVNVSDSPSKEAALRAWFGRKGSSLCGARGFIPALRPGERQEIWMKCVELTGFGSVARGLTLAETTDPVEYEISLASRETSVMVLKASLASRIL
jgi:hypothetical protein